MKRKNIIIISCAVAILLATIGFCSKQYYHYTVSNFTSLDSESHAYHIYPNTSIDSILTLLKSDYKLGSEFAWCIQCKYKKFTQAKPGHYHFAAKISNREIIRRFQFGDQTPIRLSFTQSIRTREQLAGLLGQKLLLDSAEIKLRLDDPNYMAKFGLNPETAVCMFIPTPYEVYWTTDADKLFARMFREYNTFWNEKRIKKAQKLGLTPVEVTTIASIIASETNKKEEYPTIASIYINRLKKGIALQACPTVIFATGDFTLRRVLKRHLEIDSPYNTYKYAGLPPGPIRLARPDIIDAVLNAPNTNYLFMCANPDFSGTHIFSSTYAQHSAVARQYQQELNRRKIQ